MGDVVDIRGAPVRDSTIDVAQLKNQTVKLKAGLIAPAKEHFETLADFKRVLLSLIDRYMKPEFSKEQPLFLRPGISFVETTEGIEFYHSDKFRLRFRGADDLSPALYHDVLKKLRIGGKTACDIAGELLEEKETFPAYVFFILKKFEQAGLFLEPYELETQKPS